ncbi:hypothetical protein ISN75_10335 [Dyella marensis]|uniref:hypothetical protein n=1 Tax=Dyella marensis TaxID=500610 RepID=UPI0031DA966C
MNPLLPLNTPDVLPAKPAPPKPNPRKDFEAHVRSSHASEQSGADGLSQSRQHAQPHADDAAAPLDVRLAMAGMSGRIYPQGLHATGYLSMLDSNRDGADGHAAGGVSPELALASTPDAMPVPHASADAMAVGSDADAVAIRTDGMAIPIERDSSATVEATALRTGTSGDFAEWARRMVRLSDGTATLWIRDYRLDAPQQRALVEQLHSFARGAGQPLQRIVLNGQDIWRAGAVNQDIGKGEPHGR